MIPLPLFIPVGTAAILPTTTGLRGLMKDNGALITLATMGALALTIEAKNRRSRKASQVDAISELAQDFGSANVVASSGYHRTAIKRKKTSAPLRHLQQTHPDLLRGKVVDFGSGRGADCRAIKARCYDPNHPSASTRTTPKGAYDTVLMTYVINVLPPEERAKAIRQAKKMVRKGGTLVVATRSQADPGYRASMRWQKHGDGHAQFQQGELKRFQKFYTQAGLRREMKSRLGSGFRRVGVQKMGGHTELAAYRRER